MITYHIHNSDFADLVKRPSLAKTGDTFFLPKDVMGFQGPSCSGMRNVLIPAGNYVIVSRKHFRGGTQAIKAV